MKRSTAWAIFFDGEEHRSSFAGVFFFASNLQPWHDGMRTALFRMRAEARKALNEKFPKGSFARASYRPGIARVRVDISVQRYY